MSQQLVLITGAGSGIGQALSVALAARGHSLALWDLSSQGLATTRALLPPGARARQDTVDVTREEQVEEALGRVEEELGPIGVLVCNAGVVNPPTLLKEGNMKLWRGVVDVNCLGTLTVVSALVPLLASRRKGHVVFISSVVGQSVIPNHVVYGASKAFVEGLASGLRREGLRDGLKVTVVRPSATETNLGAGSRRPKGLERPEVVSESQRVQMEWVSRIEARGLPWVMKAEDVASQVAHLIGLPEEIVVNELNISAIGLPE